MGDDVEVRTIGELRSAGYNGIRIVCPDCSWVVITWWNLLGQPDRMRFPRLVSKLRCQRCGAKPEPADVRPYQRGEDAPKKML